MSLDLPVNTELQLLVKRGDVLSVPQTFAVAAAQPGIFTLNQLRTGQGSIVNATSNVVADVQTQPSTFIGDYQALAVDNRTIHPLWNDTQNGKSQEIHTASLGFQVFTRR